MSVVVVRANAEDFASAAKAYRVGGKLFEVAVVRAMNRGGDAGSTAVKKRLVEATGIKASDTRRSKGFGRKPATVANPAYSLSSRSNYTPLAYFNPVQTETGVRATPWNRSQTFTGTFMLRMSSGYVGVFRRVKHAARAQVTTRSGKIINAKPIKELYGPSLAVEMLRNDIPSLFRDTVGVKMMARLPRELQFAMDKARGKKK